MQISEINNKKIKETCLFLKNTKADILYLADSLGSLNPSTTKLLVKKFKSEFKLFFTMLVHFFSFGCILLRAFVNLDFDVPPWLHPQFYNYITF